MNDLFFNCSSLISLPDISQWDLFNSNISNYESDLEFESQFFSENINETQLKNFNKSYDNDIYLENFIFQIPKLKSYKKEELKKLLLSKIYNMYRLFAGCSSLKYLPNISKCNIKNTTDISLMFGGCTSLIYLPDISNWNTQKLQI